MLLRGAAAATLHEIHGSPIFGDMNWSACPDVESVPEKLSGTWVVRGTRVPADALVLNAKDGYSPEDIVAV